MLKVEDLHHVSIPVTDAERSRKFYKSILGLEEIERPNFGFPGVWFRLGSRQLHLIQHSEAKTLRGTNEKRKGVRLCLFDYCGGFLPCNYAMGGWQS